VPPDESGLLTYAIWIPLLPVLAAVVIGLLGRPLLKGRSHWPAIIGVGGSLLAGLVVLVQVGRMDPEKFGITHHVYSWISQNFHIWPLSGFSFDVNFRIDPLTAIMLVTVCAISFFVIIYSRDYMREHNEPVRGYERFFAFMSLFVFSMCTLVLAGNFLLLYLGWELVGLCSYLLIGFYYWRPAAAEAAKKAFIVNRIGDFGFGLGVLLIYLWISPLTNTGRPLDYDVVFATIGQLEGWQCTTIALLLFCGAVGKSAQLPLYVWLPDAMEGPSPVSALIHAATMVTAGVYMVVRCGAIFVESEIAMAVVAVIGAATALYAATIALAQYDMKRILAYSTISQLGYMFLAVGVFAADAAVFHLFTHAFFKALLFLAAGSVMHAMGGIIDVRQFSGLRRVLPVTCITFIVGALALSGVPFFSGFFSKDEIIHAAFEQHAILGLIGLFTAVLTAFYTFRMVFLAFWGPRREPNGVHAHECGAWMQVAMILLAIGACGAGYFGVTAHSGGFAGFLEPEGIFHEYLAPVVTPFVEAGPHRVVTAQVEHGAAGGGHAMMYLSSFLAIGGILVAYILYVRRGDWLEALYRKVTGIYRILNNKYYVDEFNDAAVVRPLFRGGNFLFRFDQWVIDGLVWLVSAVPQAGGAVLRVFQNGAIQNYGVVMTVGLALLVLIAWLAV